MSVYVDDFKCAGNAKALPVIWKELSEHMELEAPVKMHENVYLGCEQRAVEIPQEMVEEKRAFFNRVCAVEETESPARGNPTPPAQGNLTPQARGNPQQKKSAKTASSMPCKCDDSVRGYEYRMRGHAEQCVERYLELSGKKIDTLKPVATPCIDDHLFGPDDFIEKGHLSPVAARIVLKALYLARIGRPELLWAVNSLAREVTKWTVACDKRLHRLISYIHHRKEHVMTCFVGDKPEDCYLVLFSDASFAGDLKDSKSTSGGYLCLVGPKTFVPITWMCKKQGAVSHSSSEAEVIALDACTRMEGVPALMFWDLVIDVFSDSPESKPRKEPARGNSTQIDPRSAFNVDFVPPSLEFSSGRAKLILLEDNDAVVKMTLKRRSPNMRHVARTHRVDLDWLWDRINDDPGIRIKFVGTKEQIADIFTKGSFTEAQWRALCKLAQIGPSYASKPANAAADLIKASNSGVLCC